MLNEQRVLDHLTGSTLLLLLRSLPNIRRKIEGFGPFLFRKVNNNHVVLPLKMVALKSFYLASKIQQPGTFFVTLLLPPVRLPLVTCWPAPPFRGQLYPLKKKKEKSRIKISRKKIATSSCNKRGESAPQPHPFSFQPFSHFQLLNDL